MTPPRLVTASLWDHITMLGLKTTLTTVSSAIPVPPFSRGRTGILWRGQDPPILKLNNYNYNQCLLLVSRL